MSPCNLSNAEENSTQNNSSFSFLPDIMKCGSLEGIPQNTGI
jgi:hypothetical protein